MNTDITWYPTAQIDLARDVVIPSDFGMPACGLTVRASVKGTSAWSPPIS